MTRTGQLDWNSVLDAQCLDPKRNQLIVDIILHFKSRFFLILCKRKEQAFSILHMLKERDVDATSLIGAQKRYNLESRVLVGTNSKIGVGFNHAKLDSLIIASDLLEYYIQYMGRVFRRPDVEPIIFDLVDENGVLKSHFRERSKVYTECGGTIKDFQKEFPFFKMPEF